MPFNTLQVNNIAYPAADTAAVAAVNNLGGGLFSVDSTQYGGAFDDFWGTHLDANIATTKTLSYNSTLAPGILTYQYTYQDGHTAPAFGGDVLAWNAHDILVQQIDGFVPINQSAGTYAGTLDPAHFVIFGGEDLSFESNSGNGPNLPIQFGQTGSFSVRTPEPSTYALLALALVAIVVVRMPLFRRVRGRFTA